MSKKKLAVVGGGAAGHQIAHDLMDVMDVMDVTDRRLPAASSNTCSCRIPTARQRAEQICGWVAKDLQSRGVNLVLGRLVVSPEMAQQPADGVVGLKSGQQVAADVVIWAAGTQPLTGFIQESWPNLVDTNGLMATDAHLRVKGHPTVFIAGDITDRPEGRLVIAASFHVTRSSSRVVRRAQDEIRTHVHAQIPEDGRLGRLKPARGKIL